MQAGHYYVTKPLAVSELLPLAVVAWTDTTKHSAVAVTAEKEPTAHDVTGQVLCVLQWQ